MRWFGIGVVAAAVFLSSCAASAVAPDHIPESVSVANISWHLRDADRSLTLSDVTSGEASSRLAPHGAAAFSFGLTRAAHWIRFSLDDPALNRLRSVDRLTLTLDYAPLEDIRVYVPIRSGAADGGHDGRHYRKALGGWGHVSRRTDSSFLFPSFELPPDTDRSGDIIVRVETSLTANFRMAVTDSTRFARTEFRVVLILGLLAGILIAMGFYNLVLYFVLRDRIYLLYLGYLAIMLVYQSSLVGLPRLIGAGVQELTTSRILIWSLITVATALRFSWVFLDVPRSARQMRPVYLGMWGLCAVGLLIFAFGYRVTANGVTHAVAFLLPFAGFGAAWLSYRNGHRVSLYFLAASTVLLVSVNVFALRGLGVVPHNYLTTYGFFAAAAIEAILYSFALADRVRQLRSEHSGLTRRAAELTNMSMTDELTGLYNRRFFDRVLPTSIDHARATMKPLSLVYVDLDGFKQLNDSRGHACGDTVLRTVGSIIRASVRGGDYPCRIGGDEFALILPGAHATEARLTAERIREGIEQKRVIPP
ncbi:MAG: GGDEF domain-containing protein, partial [Spirochaetaceae bacterium]